MRIWVDENIPMGREAFAAHGEVTLFAGRGLKRFDLASADALLVRSVTRVDAALLEPTMSISPTWPRTVSVSRRPRAATPIRSASMSLRP
jgi:erythronate-4-phosphate dehydrogenase